MCMHRIDFSDCEFLLFCLLPSDFHPLIFRINSPNITKGWRNFSYEWKTFANHQSEVGVKQFVRVKEFMQIVFDRKMLRLKSNLDNWKSFEDENDDGENRESEVGGASNCEDESLNYLPERFPDHRHRKKTNKANFMMKNFSLKNLWCF